MNKRNQSAISKPPNGKPARRPDECSCYCRTESMMTWHVPLPATKKKKNMRRSARRRKYTREVLRESQQQINRLERHIRNLEAAKAGAFAAQNETLQFLHARLLMLEREKERSHTPWYIALAIVGCNEIDWQICELILSTLGKIIGPLINLI